MNENDENEVEIEMPEQDKEGHVEKFQLQTGNRVKIPDDWNEQLGLEEGDEIAVVCEEDRVVVMGWDLEKIKEL